APLYFQQQGSDDHTIVFGSGGETIDGKLYATTLSDLMKGDISSAKVLASEVGHGFIAPPVAADINQDGQVDIIAISHASSVFAIDGKTLEPLWQQKIDGTESSNSFAVGYFAGDDEVPGFLTFVLNAKWRDSTV